ncbi:MAG: aspartate kinase, partial [Patescibacteria group bacterium]|nr:aspartate kinase [Patescibacteria group bacterium]
MITVPEATKKIIERSRYLSESMSKGLLNYSALARYIRPEIEEILFKDVSESSIIMALKRLEPYFKPKFKAIDVFKSTPEMIVRSNLEEITLTNTMEVTNNL